LREDPDALGRAHLVLVSADEDEEAQKACAVLTDRLGRRRVMRVRRRPAGFFDLAGAAVPPPSRAFLLTGIARPERVASDLAAQGLALAGHAAHPDHHRFRADEVASVMRRALAAGADAIVTTAKDATRLPGPERPLPILVFRVRCEVDDPPAFRERLLAAAEGRPQ